LDNRGSVIYFSGSVIFEGICIVKTTSSTQPLKNPSVHDKVYCPTSRDTCTLLLAPTSKMSSEEDRVKKQREAGERESARLWRAWRTIHEMVQDRGYELSEEEVKISLDDFKIKFTGEDGSIKYAPLLTLDLPFNIR
jgi:hypothetical protein